MKFSGALLILASLALGVISTPVQSQENAVAARESAPYEVDALEARDSPSDTEDGESWMERGVEEAVDFPYDTADDELSVERRAAGAVNGVNAANAGIQLVKAQIQIILGGYVTLQQAFKSIGPGYTLRKIYVVQNQMVAFITAIVKVSGALNHVTPCTTKADAKAFTNLICYLVDSVCHLLIAICGALKTFKLLNCVYIWRPLILWLEAVILIIIDLAIVVVKIDSGCKVILAKLRDPFKLAVANAIKVLGK